MNRAIDDYVGGTEFDRQRAWPSTLPSEDEDLLRGALIDGTTIATDAGWRPVETLQEGDWILGADGKFCVLKGVERHKIWAAHGFPRRVWPLRIPPDLLENATPMYLLPSQRVELGRPRILAEAGRLEGLGGVEACPPGREISVTRLDFGAPKKILANCGAALMCAGSEDDEKTAARHTGNVTPLRRL